MTTEQPRTRRPSAPRGACTSIIVLVAALAFGWSGAAPAAAVAGSAVASTAARSRSPASRAKKTPAIKKKSAPRATVGPIDVGNPREAQVEQTAERDRLTARIAELKKQIAAGERSRSGATQALQRAERALGDVNRRIAELSRLQREGQERVAGLDRQRSGAASQLDARQTALGRTATLVAANRQRDPSQVFEGGGDPGSPMMTGLYLGYVARAQADEITALEGRARDLQAQRERADDENRQLLAEAHQEQSARDTLAADRVAQKRSLDDLTQQLAEQRRTADALAADEQRLTRVVEQLQHVIERQAAEERAKREAARRDAEKRDAEKRAAERRAAEQPTARSNRTPAAKAREPEPGPAVEPVVPDDSAGGGAFAQLRGQLRLPVRGVVVGRFGAPRGSGGATWKGVFVKTEAGADVRAVAAGKVVFADDLRGFGNLVIIDHGGQYLSIYGNNQTLQKRAGDTVRQGDVIAHAGDSSGDEQTGLYFELRYRGRPFDPLSWTGSR